MFSLDDRAGNAVTTVAVFMLGATILYLARGAFLILFLSLFFAYLLDPAVTSLQMHSRLGHKNRTWAIAQVYLIATLVFGGLGYEFGPHLAAQIRNLTKVLPQIVEGLSSGNTSGGPSGGNVLRATQQARIQDLLARHHDFIAHVFERGAASAASVTASAIWLFAVPLLAIFILRDGRQMMAGFSDTVGARGDHPAANRILKRVDTMLAKYIRAQLALAGLSFAFYSVSMAVLRFPYAIPLGLVGGVLEFLPAVGWIASALAILTIGYLTHGHWIWMAGLLVVWRLMQNYVNSPRIMGENLELQPLTVVFALMVGAQVGGITGVYLSVPVVAVLRIVWLECFSSRNSPTVQADRTIIQVTAPQSRS